MKLIRKVTSYALATWVLAAGAQQSHAATWVAGNGKSCEQACQKKGLEALSSGIFMPNGEPTNDYYYVCAADYLGGGYRGGFNLRPSWHTVCMVPWGGKEVRVRDYICACE